MAKTTAPKATPKNIPSKPSLQIKNDVPSMRNPPAPPTKK